MAYAQSRSGRGRWVLACVVVVFLLLSIPRYLTGDPAQSRVPSTFPLHYSLLVAHVLFASVAMAAAVIQVWPRVRTRYPAAHRFSGWIYVFGAVLPAGATGLIIGAATPFGAILAVSNVIAALLWLGFTAAGFRAARKRDFAAHRRWMMRSVVLTFSIISNRVWAVVLFAALSPLRDTLFGGDERLFTWVLTGLTGWLGWTIPLVVAEYWLRHRRHGNRAVGSSHVVDHRFAT